MGNRKRIRPVVQETKKFDGGGAQRSAIKSHRDVDSGDDFEEAQDKILLEGQVRDHRATAGDLEASDEEILALSGVSDDELEEDSETDDDEAEEEEEEREEGWGDSKKEYYNADDLTDEEDLKAEAQEALRIQKKNLEKLDAAAYVDDLDEWKDEADENEETVEALPTSISADLPKSELIKILHTRNPEFAPFALEFNSLIGELDHLDALAQRKFHPQHAILQAKVNALRSYLAVLAFYFALMSSQESRSLNIKEHEIMISLVRCRQAWQHVASIAIDENLSTIVTNPASEVTVKTKAPKPRKRKRSSRPATEVNVPNVVESYAPDVDNELEETFRALKSMPKKRKTQQVLPDLADNTADSIEAEDAAARRKTLQFYASQINSKAARRNNAMQSGDQDLPYRERRKERELRLQAEAERRKGGTAGADLDDEETRPRGVAGDGNDDDDDDGEEYYQLIAAAQKAEKVNRKQTHDAVNTAIRAERAGYEVAADLITTADGKRKIGRDIEKNKGTTVRRPKENRNARVKKRNKYEAAKKKLGSKKAIYKQPTGSYGGEASGINTRVIKSTKMDQGSDRKR